MARGIFLVFAAVLCLSACSREDNTPKGRWEGFSESQNWLIVARLELQKGGEMRASALSAFVAEADLPRRHELETELRAGMKDQWSAVTKTDISFTGNTITRKDGYAPLFIFEPGSGAMIFHFYAGGKLTEKVTLVNNPG